MSPNFETIPQPEPVQSSEANPSDLSNIEKKPEEKQAEKIEGKYHEGLRSSLWR